MRTEFIRRTFPNQLHIFSLKFELDVLLQRGTLDKYGIEIIAGGIDGRK